MEFSRQEYWSALPLPTSGDLPDSGLEPMSLVSPTWEANSLPLAPHGKPTTYMYKRVYICKYTHIYMYIRRRQRQPTPALLPGKSHGWRSLVGCSPWGRSESDTTERLYFPFSLSCIGQGNGNTPQYSCLENPRDGGAWWAAVYGVAQSRTRLKWLSSIHVYTEWRYITVFLLRKLRLYFFNVLHIRQ